VLPRRLRSAALLCALLASLAALSGCSSGREGGAGREGRPDGLGGLAYEVYLTRELNLKDNEDSAYYPGPQAPPGYALFGVFVSVCNESRGGPAYPAAAVNDYKIIDTNGDQFSPLPLPTTDVFAYRPQSVKHRECIPQAGTLAADGPTAGAMLLFQLPLQATENRPLDLIIHGPRDPQTGRSTGVRRIELDV
jgi:hypothetical protein